MLSIHVPPRPTKPLIPLEICYQTCLENVTDTNSVGHRKISYRLNTHLPPCHPVKVERMAHPAKVLVRDNIYFLSLQQKYATHHRPTVDEQHLCCQSAKHSGMVNKRIEQSLCAIHRRTFGFSAWKMRTVFIKRLQVVKFWRSQLICKISQKSE